MSGSVSPVAGRQVTGRQVTAGGQPARWQASADRVGSGQAVVRCLVGRRFAVTRRVTAARGPVRAERAAVGGALGERGVVAVAVGLRALVAVAVRLRVLVAVGVGLRVLVAVAVGVGAGVAVRAFVAVAVGKLLGGGLGRRGVAVLGRLCVLDRWALVSLGVGCLRRSPLRQPRWWLHAVIHAVLPGSSFDELIRQDYRRRRMRPRP